MLNCRRQRSSKSTTLRSTATDDHHETMNFYNSVNPHAEGFWLLEIYSANVANPLYSSRAKKKLKQNTVMRQIIFSRSTIITTAPFGKYLEK